MTFRAGRRAVALRRRAGRRAEHWLILPSGVYRQCRRGRTTSLRVGSSARRAGTAVDRRGAGSIRSRSHRRVDASAPLRSLRTRTLALRLCRPLRRNRGCRSRRGSSAALGRRFSWSFLRGALLGSIALLKVPLCSTARLAFWAGLLLPTRLPITQDSSRFDHVRGERSLQGMALQCRNAPVAPQRRDGAQVLVAGGLLHRLLELLRLLPSQAGVHVGEARANDRGSLGVGAGWQLATPGGSQWSRPRAGSQQAPA
mmetsp:Transcript_85644/g.191480  ORF Transcript_85644/g.191480 Transcript_85644/m.191480 type:complete len:256 (+) Transcript_85644:677-1444(+)